MVDVQVELSQVLYKPGQTVKATIVLSRSVAARKSAKHESLDSGKLSSPQRARRRSRTDSINSRDETEEKGALKSPTSPTSPTTPVSILQNDRSQKQSRAKSKSVSFSPAISPTHARRASRTSMSYFVNDIENLLIVYAQLSGHFTIENDLLTSQKFEHLRGQGIDSASGGGLISSSTITNPRWSFSSLSSVLAGTKQSSLADLRLAASSNSMPILSMPPTILAVDLRLTGDRAERQIYSFDLPTRLPGTFVGKTMVITYVLKLSAQHQDNTTTTFECPIHVSCVEEPTYNFLEPHLFKQPSGRVDPHEADDRMKSKSNSTKQDFLDFLAALDADRALPSPVEERKSILPNIPSFGRTAQLSRDRGMQFDVSQSKDEHVCKVLLSKSAYAPGELISGTLDFGAAQLHCFACTISLEAHEHLDSAFTTMTPDQVSNATRNVLGRERIVTAFTLSTTFDIGVPATAVDSFKTVPLSLEYSLLFKFIIYDQETLTSEVRTKHGIEAFPVEDVMGEMFECRIPVTIRTTHLGGTTIKTGRL